MFDNERLRKRRIDMGLTQEEVGAVVGISRSAVQKYEKNVIKNVYTSTVELFAQALRCSPAYLLGWTDDPREGLPGFPTDEPMAGDEKKFLNLYRDLNDEGKERLLRYAEDLVASGNYKKYGSAGMVQES